ncbi:MAG: hypothetical protein ACR2KT_15440 [Methylocella sp.]|nr:MAG: hypothetical protein DLM68_05685 [Hyphomicrobiales bacterium]
MTTQAALEKAVLEKLLNGRSETFQILLRQYQASSVIKREMTGAGFFTYLSVPRDIPQLSGAPSFSFGDVHADLTGLKHGAGFLLTINKGYIYDIEGYSYEEPWPRNFELIRLFYDDNRIRNEEKVIRSFHARRPIE